MALNKLENLRFDNLALRALPVESGPPRTPRPVPGACFSLTEPTPLDNPRIVAVSDEALRLIGLDPAEARERPDEFAAYFSGNKLPPGARPAAHCYAGFQFGSFAGQLGDGAAMYLGECVSAAGERWELQLKGAGLTPYSRAADGRKVLRSSLREFLASEAMAALGVPTTRAAALVTSDTRVERDPFYDGRPVMERASVVARVAPTFLRFGSFEIFRPTDPNTGRAGPSAGREADMLPGMVDYAARAHFPEIWAAHGGPPGLEGGGGSGSGSGDAITPAQRVEIACDMFAEACRRTARLVARWQLVGFCHGVLNTDNMSLVGLTLDYGPYGFLDRYDPHHVCNGSDDAGRYSFAAQPSVCRWNCEQLAAALGGALVPPARARAGLAAFDREYAAARRAGLRRKLGLLRADEGADDDALAEALLDVMEATGADYTATWRRLAAVPMPGAGGNGGGDGNGGGMATDGSGAAATDGAAPAEAAAAAGASGSSGAEGAEAATGGGPSDDAAAAAAPLGFDDGGFLAATLAELATPAEIAAGAASRVPPENLQMLAHVAARDPGMLHALGIAPEFVKRELGRAAAAAKWRATAPEAKAAADRAAWRAWLTRYAARLRREAAAGASPAERAAAMRAANPRVVLRGYAAEEAIQAAERGDYAAVADLLAVLRRPYDEASELGSLPSGRRGKEGGDGSSLAGAPAGAPEPEAGAAGGGVCPLRLGGKPPAWAAGLCVTCSS